FEFNFLKYALHDPITGTMRVFVIEETGLLPPDALEFAVQDSPSGWVWMHHQPLVIGELQAETRFRPAVEVFLRKGFRSLILLPMSTPRKKLGALGFGSTRPRDCDPSLINFLQQISGLAALAVENSLLKEAIAGEEEQLRSLTAVSIQLSERSASDHAALRAERERLEVVLEINAALAGTRLDVKQIFPAISRSLAKAVPHDTAVINLWNEEQRNYLVFAKSSNQGPDFAPAGMVLPSENAFTTQVLDRHPEGTIVRRAELETAARHFEVVRSALDAGIVCWCTVPMRTPSHLVGVLYLGSREEDVFTGKHLDLVRQVAP